MSVTEVARCQRCSKKVVGARYKVVSIYGGRIEWVCWDCYCLDAEKPKFE